MTSASANNGDVYLPPHLNVNHPANSRNNPAGDTRYSKDQMLSIFQTLKDSSALDRNLEDIFLGSWDPLEAKLPSTSQALRGDGKDQTPGPEVCWNYNVNPEPFGLMDMTDEDKQVRKHTSSRRDGILLIVYIAALFDFCEFTYQDAAESGEGRYGSWSDRRAKSFTVGIQQHYGGFATWNASQGDQ